MNLDQIRDRNDRDRLRSQQGSIVWNQVMEDRRVLLLEVDWLRAKLSVFGVTEERIPGSNRHQPVLPMEAL
jgi:hypothetical protein